METKTITVHHCLDTSISGTSQKVALGPTNQIRLKYLLLFVVYNVITAFLYNCNKTILGTVKH